MTVGFAPENPEVKVTREYLLTVEVPDTGDDEADFVEADKAAKESIQDLGDNMVATWISTGRNRPPEPLGKRVYQFKVW